MRRSWRVRDNSPPHPASSGRRPQQRAERQVHRVVPSLGITVAKEQWSQWCLDAQEQAAGIDQRVEPYLTAALPGIAGLQTGTDVDRRGEQRVHLTGAPVE